MRQLGEDLNCDRRSATKGPICLAAANPVQERLCQGNRFRVMGKSRRQQLPAGPHRRHRRPRHAAALKNIRQFQLQLVLAVFAPFAVVAQPSSIEYDFRDSGRHDYLSNHPSSKGRHLFSAITGLDVSEAFPFYGLRAPSSSLLGLGSDRDENSPSPPPPPPAGPNYFAVETRCTTAADPLHYDSFYGLPGFVIGLQDFEPDCSDTLVLLLSPPPPPPR